MKANANAWEDYLDVITKGHILTADMEYLGMSALDAQPNPSIIDPTI